MDTDDGTESQQEVLSVDFQTNGPHHSNQYLHEPNLNVSSVIKKVVINISLTIV